MFVAALVTTANRWKQPKCPSMDKQNLVYMYNGMLFNLKYEGTDGRYNMDEP